MSCYADWITREVFLSRTAAQPDVLARAIRLFAAGTAQIGQPAVQNVLYERMLQNPKLRRAVVDDPILRNAFSRFLQPIRSIGGLEFEQMEYMAAASAAHRGESASIRDRRGLTFTLRELSVLNPRVTGVAAVAEEQIVAFDADWRRLLPNADSSEIEQLVRPHRLDLELSEAQLEQLLSQLEEAQPVERIRIMDNVVSSLTEGYLEAIRHRLTVGLFPEELIPTPVQHLDYHVGLDGADVVDLETLARTLLSRCKAVTVFERLAGLPVRMPSIVIDRCIEDLGSVRAFVRLLVRTIGTPVSRLHALRVIRERLPVESGRRLARRVAFSLIGSFQDGEIASYLEWIRSITDELLRRSESRDWPVAKRFAVSWIYGHQAMRVLTEAGYSAHEAAETRSGMNCHDEMFAGEPAGLSVVFNPRLVGAAQLLIGGLADAANGPYEAHIGETLRTLLRHEFAPLPWNPALYHAIGSGTWLDGSRVQQLQMVLGDSLSPEDIATFSDDYLARAIGELSSRPEHLAFVNARLTAIEPPEIALQWLREEMANADARTDLFESVPLLWRVRLVTIARLWLMREWPEKDNAMQRIWENVLASIPKDEVPSDENAMAIIELAGYIARARNSYAERVALFSELLAHAAEVLPSLALVLGPFVRRLLKRLAPSVLTPALGRAALLARFRVA